MGSQARCDAALQVYRRPPSTTSLLRGPAQITRRRTQRVDVRSRPGHFSSAANDRERQSTANMDFAEIDDESNSARRGSAAYRKATALAGNVASRGGDDLPSPAATVHAMRREGRDCRDTAGGVRRVGKASTGGPRRACRLHTRQRAVRSSRFRVPPRRGAATRSVVSESLLISACRPSITRLRTASST